jgi:hypothetical protein
LGLQESPTEALASVILNFREKGHRFEINEKELKERFGLLFF